MRDTKDLWQRCVEFHGHECGGLKTGYKAALYAAELLDLAHAEDEETVCIAECDACSVDAIQVVLGCSVGKGNLLFHMTGKFAFSFYNRRTGKSVRLVQAKRGSDLLQEEMFAVQNTVLPLPERARSIRDVVCAVCGETFAENYAHLENGRTICPDCYEPYDRFEV